MVETDGERSRDLRIASAALYQLSYCPIKLDVSLQSGAGERCRSVVSALATPRSAVELHLH
jgi:hypothetical protein